MAGRCSSRLLQHGVPIPNPPCDISTTEKGGKLLTKLKLKRMLTKKLLKKLLIKKLLHKHVLLKMLRKHLQMMKNY